MSILSSSYVFLYCISHLLKHMIYLKVNNFLFLFLVFVCISNLKNTCTGVFLWVVPKEPVGSILRICPLE